MRLRADRLAGGHADQIPGTSFLTQVVADRQGLGRLVGGDTIAAFPGLSVRGVFDEAHMTVTVSP